MELWGALGGMIILAVLGIDASGAHRFVPVVISRLRRAMRGDATRTRW